jgi:hypothetical protein
VKIRALPRLGYLAIWSLCHLTTKPENTQTFFANKKILNYSQTNQLSPATASCRRKLSPFSSRVTERSVMLEMTPPKLQHGPVSPNVAMGCWHMGPDPGVSDPKLHDVTSEDLCPFNTTAGWSIYRFCSLFSTAGWSICHVCSFFREHV